eukprot:10376312-Ditylum_brightwellii.AAC.1
METLPLHACEDYSRYPITQALGLKNKLENLHVKWNNVTIMSLDIVNMYPSTRLSLIKKALHHYFKDLSTTDK